MKDRDLLGPLLMLFGLSILVYNMQSWYQNQASIALGGTSSVPMVADFYLVQVLSTILFLAGTYLSYRAILWPAGGATGVRAILADIVSSRRLLRIGIIAAALYGILYAFGSGTIVFQPTVDFGVAAPTVLYGTCCGSLGTIPELVIYVAPVQHVAMQVVPLSLLLLLTVPPLVGLNVMVTLRALGNSAYRVAGRWLLASGAVVGLFTACPTCAGLFIADSLGGLGAVSLAVTLATYQFVFIGVSIPVLLLSPYLTALSMKRSFDAGCAVPQRQQPE